MGFDLGRTGQRVTSNVLMTVWRRLPLAAKIVVGAIGFAVVLTVEFLKAKLSGPVDLNRASIEQLHAIPQVGPVIAQTILKGRPYQSVDDLLKVPGIGPKTLETMRFPSGNADLIGVGDFA